MKDIIDYVAASLLFLLVAVGLFAVGGALGMKMGREAVQKEAMARGVGELKIDPRTGQPVFAWRKSP